MAELTLTIQGTPGTVSLRAFLRAFESELQILSDLDSAISGKVQGSVEWVVTDLRLGSLAATVKPISRDDTLNVGPRVVQVFADGMRVIERDGYTPAYFSEESMRSARTLLKLIGRNGVSGYEIRTATARVTLTAQATVNVERLVPILARSVGSVEGRLEMVSLHSKPRFVVYHGFNRKAVTCKFNPEKWLEPVKAALGRRVNVSGLIGFNAKGEPQKIEIDDLRVLRQNSELPRAGDLHGLVRDLTGDLSTKEYLDEVRGD
jgi:hypothetical protein